MTSTLSARPRSYAPPIAAAPEIRSGMRRAGMLEVEVFGAEPACSRCAHPLATVQSLCGPGGRFGRRARDGHLAIEYVDSRRIAELNAEHRGKQGPTDVLSFPIDGVTLHDGPISHMTAPLHKTAPFHKAAPSHATAPSPTTAPSSTTVLHGSWATW